MDSGADAAFRFTTCTTPFYILARLPDVLGDDIKIRNALDSFRMMYGIKTSPQISRREKPNIGSLETVKLAFGLISEI